MATCNVGQDLATFGDVGDMSATFQAKIIVGFNSTVTMDVCTGTTRMTTHNVRLEKCDNDNSTCNII